MGSSYLDAPADFPATDFMKITVFGLLLVIVQSSLAAIFRLDGFGPEWVLVLVVYVSLRANLWVAIVCAVILGCFRDAMSGWIWGFYPFTLVMIVWMFYPFRTRLNFFSTLTLVPLIFILCFGGYLFIMAPLVAIVAWPGANFNPLPAFISSSVGTAITAPVIFRILKWLTVPRKPLGGETEK